MDSEVLVHISAASGVADDARYRAQVEAILGFQSASRQTITLKPDLQLDHDDAASDVTGGDDTLPFTSPEDATQSARGEPTSKGAATANHHPHPQVETTTISTASDSLDSPVSVIPDSQPERSHFFVPPRPHLGYVQDGQYSALIPPRPSEGLEQGPTKRRRLDSSSPPPDPDLDPASDPRSPPPDLPPDDPRIPILECEHEHGQEKKQNEEAQHHHANDQDPNHSKKPQLDTFPERSLNSDTPAQNPPAQPQSNPRSRSQTQAPPDLSSLPLSIRPPQPPISASSHFTTHITPTLSMLYQRLYSPRTYSPSHQTRALDALERGHWYIPLTIILDDDQDRDHEDSRPSPVSPSQKQKKGKKGMESPRDRQTWDLALFTRFWFFLADFITEGRAGWGVWCSLEGDEKEKTNTSSSSISSLLPAAAAATTTTETSTTIKPQDKTEERNEKAKSPPRPSSSYKTRNPNSNSNSNSHFHSRSRSATLKLYAWGEIASHVYLLLFLASERRIRKMGAQWRDGRDEVVVQMD